MSTPGLAIIAFLFQLASSDVIKSVYLTPSNTNQHGTSISITHSDCTVINNQWNIIVSSNSNAYQGYHLQIDLDNSWGFHPNKPSTIYFTINATSTISHPIFSFSVHNHQYLTHWLSFDQTTQNKIYPSIYTRQTCASTQNTTVPLGFGDVKICVENTTCLGHTERSDKATAGDKWGFYQPKDNTMNIWPITITLLNDPINNQLFTSLNTQRCVYGESFDTNNGLQIYIAADKEGESINFTSFEITYDRSANVNEWITMTWLIIGMIGAVLTLVCIGIALGIMRYYRNQTKSLNVYIAKMKEKIKRMDDKYDEIIGDVVSTEGNTVNERLNIELETDEELWNPIYPNALSLKQEGPIDGTELTTGDINRMISEDEDEDYKRICADCGLRKKVRMEKSTGLFYCYDCWVTRVDDQEGKDSTSAIVT